MKNIAFYLRGYVKETILAPLFKMLEALLELFVPVVVKNIIDTGIGSSDKLYVMKMCGILALLAFAGLAFSVTAQYFAAKAAVGACSELRRELFRKTLSFSYGDTDTVGTSTLISRLTGDVDLIQNGINLTLRLLLRSPFVVFGAMAAAFAVDKTTALTFVGTIPALSVVVFSIMLGSMPLYKTVRKYADGLVSSTRSALGGVRVIRAFGREEQERRKFGEVNGLLTDASLKAGRISALINPLTYVIINAAIIILIKTGAVRVNGGLMTQGAVVAQYNYMSQILVELIKLANLIITITKALACSKRVKTVLDTVPSMNYPENGAAPSEDAPAIEFENVGFAYPGAREQSLSSVSFTAERGERIGIIGATGSGKSTLINLIPRFYDATSGTVKLFGNDVREYSEETLQALVAVVPQKAALFRGTIKDNLLWGRAGATDEQTENVVKTAQAEDIIRSRPLGLLEPVEEGGKNFSGGQRQRLTIARALMKNSPVLILDDAASALDLATEARLRKALAELPGTTVVTVSQRVTSVMNCEKIIVTDDGNVAGIGTHTELLENCPVYKEIFESQNNIRS